MHPRRGKTQHRSASKIRHSQASPARLRQRGRVLVGKGWWILRAIAIGYYGVKLARAISYLNRDVARGRVIGDVVFNMADSTLRLDLGDGVSIGAGLGVLDIKGDVSVSVVSRRLEDLAVTVLELERELTFLEGSAFKSFLCLDNR